MENGALFLSDGMHHEENVIIIEAGITFGRCMPLFSNQHVGYSYSLFNKCVCRVQNSEAFYIFLTM